MISKKRVIAGSIVLSLAACLIYFQNSNDDFAANHGELSTLKNENCDKIESSSSAEFSTPLPIQFKSTSSLNKVFFESSSDSVRGSNYQLDVELAKNEYEATQLLISADSNITNISVEVSDLINCETQSTLKASEHVEINTVAYINVDVENQKANLEEPVLVASNGWYPDPLLRNQRITLKPNELQPFLITINTSQETHAGD